MREIKIKVVLMEGVCCSFTITFIEMSREQNDFLLRLFYTELTMTIPDPCSMQNRSSGLL